MNEQTDGRMDAGVRWMDGWMGGWTNGQTYR